MSGIRGSNRSTACDQTGWIQPEEDETQTEEQAPLKHLVHGNPTIFWKLWLRYEDYLYDRCLQWMSGNHEETEDVLSKARLKVWDNLPNCAGEIKHFKAWVMQLTRNLCVDAHRERKHHVKSIESIADIHNLGHTQESSEDSLLRHESHTYIRCAIDSLPPRLREPAILRFCEEMSYPDIAAELALSPTNIRKRIQQARAILQENLNPYLSGKDAPVWALGRGDEPAATPQIKLATAATDIQEREEIRSRIRTMSVVQVTLPSAAKMQFHIGLEHKPTRQRQKIEALSKYVQRHPGGWKKRLELADLFYAMGHWEECIEEYRQGLKKQPQLINVWLRLGSIFRLMEREEEAVSAYENALPLARKTATRLHVTGWLAVCRQRYKTAAKAFDEATSLEPSNIAHWQALGRTHLQLESPVEALRAFDAALALDSDDLTASLSSYGALVAVGRLREAQKRMVHVLEADADNVLALTRLADGRIDTGFVRGKAAKETRNLIRRAQRLAPENAAVQALLARYRILRGEWEGGVSLLGAFIEQHPNSPSGWYHYARWCFYTGSTHEAAQAIIRAYHLCPKDVRIYQAACEILPYAGKLDTLQPMLEEMRCRFPERWSVWATAGRALIEGFKEGDRACRASTRCTELQPHLAESWFQHGRVLMLSEKYEEAISALEYGCQFLPEEEGYEQSLPAAVWLGEAYRAQGNRLQSRA